MDESLVQAAHVEMKDTATHSGGGCHKRKAEDSSSSSPGGSSTEDRARIDAPGSGSDKENKPAQKKAKLEGGKGKDKDKEGSGLVELTKGGKWSVKQKVVELCDVSNAVKKDVFNLTDELDALTEPLQAFSDAQLIVIARLVHESDKSLLELARHLHAKLVPQAAFDEESQNSKPPFDRLPMDMLKAAINKVAKRTNYGIDDGEVSWIPCPVPVGLKISRWEVNDLPTVLPSDLVDKMSKRQLERSQIKRVCLDLLNGLSSQEREDLLAKLSKGKKADAASAKQLTSTASAPIVVDDEQQDTTPTSSAQKQGKVKESGSGKSKEEKEAEKEAKQREKEEKQKEKEQKKAAKEQKAAEVAQKKADREAKKKAKEDAEAAKQRETAKMDLRNFFGGGGGPLTSAPAKGSASPEVSRKPASKGSNEESKPVFATPGTPASASKHPIVIGSSPPQSTKLSDTGGSGSKKEARSDFDRAFRPFNIRTTVQLVPVNRFAKRDGNVSEVELNSRPNLTREASLAEFLRNVPEYRRPVGVRRLVPPVTVRTVVRELAECDMAGNVEGSKSRHAVLADRQKLPIKTFMFHEDTRPGYVGTWTKQTRAVRPRKPFGKDTCLLNYDYDSDADWVEEDEAGEDLDEDDEDEEGEAMSENDSEDGWLVADDEVDLDTADASDPMATDDIVFVGATNTELLEGKEKRKRQMEKKRSATREGAKKRRLVGPLIPIVKGTIWEAELGKVESQALEPFRIQFINDARVGLDPFTFVPEPINVLLGLANPMARPIVPITTVTSTNPASPTAQVSSTSIAAVAPGQTNTLQPRKKAAGFPASLMPKLIGMVDGTKRAKHVLVEDLKEALGKEVGVKVTKVAIEKALVDSAEKEGGVWKVKEEVKALFAAAA